MRTGRFSGMPRLGPTTHSPLPAGASQVGQDATRAGYRSFLMVEKAKKSPAPPQGQICEGVNVWSVSPGTRWGRKLEIQSGLGGRDTSCMINCHATPQRRALRGKRSGRRKLWLWYFPLPAVFILCRCNRMEFHWKWFGGNVIHFPVADKRRALALPFSVNPTALVCLIHHFCYANVLKISFRCLTTSISSFISYKCAH